MVASISFFQIFSSSHETHRSKGSQQWLALILLGVALSIPGCDNFCVSEFENEYDLKWETDMISSNCDLQQNLPREYPDYHRDSQQALQTYCRQFNLKGCYFINIFSKWIVYRRLGSTHIWFRLLTSYLNPSWIQFHNTKTRRQNIDKDLHSPCMVELLKRLCYENLQQWNLNFVAYESFHSRA